MVKNERDANMMFVFLFSETNSAARTLPLALLKFYKYKYALSPGRTILDLSAAGQNAI
jgi:hypothetical protein